MYFHVNLSKNHEMRHYCLNCPKFDQLIVRKIIRIVDFRGGSRNLHKGADPSPSSFPSLRRPKGSVAGSAPSKSAAGFGGLKCSQQNLISAVCGSAPDPTWGAHSASLLVELTALPLTP